jgi:hypothetical protein
VSSARAGDETLVPTTTREHGMSKPMSLIPEGLNQLGTLNIQGSSSLTIYC